MQALVVLGTRPEAIKLAPVIQALRATNRISVRICSTGQHRSMLDQVMDLFGISPDYDLALMKENQDLYYLTAAILMGMQEILQKERPSVVVVQGDTTTSLAATLGAYYAHVPVAHVEAGLRTGNHRDPFPEELNRRLTDVIADYCFAPTDASRDNLIREGYSKDRIWVTGNTVVDTLLNILRRQAQPGERDRIHDEFSRRHDLRLGERVILMTGHRRESFGPAMRSIFRGIRRIVESHADVQVIYPVHLNPNVREAVSRELAGVNRVYLVPPLDYYEFVWVMTRCHFIISDSGGIQEEAPTIGVPVLVTRESTERHEGISAGVAQLVGANERRLVEEAHRLLTDTEAHAAMARVVNPYGDGNASKRIAAILVDQLLSSHPPAAS